MTISSTTRKAGPYVGNGTATTFPFGFKVFSPRELKVIKTDAAGQEHVLTYEQDYAITLNPDQNAYPGGTLTYPLTGPKLAADEKLTAIGNLPNLQPTSITNQGGFYPHVLEDALDRATIQLQQVAETAQRSFQFPVSDPALETQLPTAVQRAKKALVFGPQGEVGLSEEEYENPAAEARKAAQEAKKAAEAARKAADEATRLGTPADNTVSTEKLVDGAVTAPKLADDAIPKKLGYTPADDTQVLHTSGGTLDGPLQVQPGCLNLYGIQYLRSADHQTVKPFCCEDDAITFFNGVGDTVIFRIQNDGNLFSPVFGLINDALNARQPAGNYVRGDDAYGYRLSWDTMNLRAFINDQYLGVLWMDRHFSPGDFTPRSSMMLHGIGSVTIGNMWSGQQGEVRQIPNLPGAWLLITPQGLATHWWLCVRVQ